MQKNSQIICLTFSLCDDLAPCDFIQSRRQWPWDVVWFPPKLVLIVSCRSRKSHINHVQLCTTRKINDPSASLPWAVYSWKRIHKYSGFHQNSCKLSYHRFMLKSWAVTRQARASRLPASYAAAWQDRCRQQAVWRKKNQWRAHKGRISKTIRGIVKKNTIGWILIHVSFWKFVLKVIFNSLFFLEIAAARFHLLAQTAAFFHSLLHPRIQLNNWIGSQN